MTTINTNIQQLLEQIKQGRLNKGSDTQLEYKQALLSQLKAFAKEKQLDILELSYIDYLDVVRKRFTTTKGAAINFVSKSNDKKVGDSLVPDMTITYSQLNLEQILSLNPTNTNLESLVRELEYLQESLPQQLTQEQMLDIISDNNLTNIKDIMAYFKATYANQYENKLLASVAKSIV
jgi:hypothetical protein